MNNTTPLTVRIEIPGLEMLAQALLKLADSGIMSAVQGIVEETVPAQETVQPQQTPVQMTSQPVTPVQQIPQSAPQQVTPVPPVPQPAAQPTIPVQPVPMAAVPVQAQPVPVANAPVQQPQVIPTTEVPVTRTYDELAVAASQLVNMGKQQRLFEILAGFGVQSLMELPKEKYAAFAGCLQSEGVKM